MPYSLASEDYETFVSGLVAARKERGLTQVELAKRLGKPQSWVSKTERTERRIDPVEFCALAEALGFEPSQLLRQLRERLHSPVRL
jgi:transcriptional regulator with XRE-family HTH domain